ncbi:YtxH domain-containing protein [Candidatus Gracilibacteria bacterium]|nr:YtxH domain-containing protein [Candidatus Gracilibacteria bacterium]
MSLFKILFGATTGLAVGLLFAKKSGNELRNDLKGKTSEEKAKILGNEILKTGKDLLEELKKIPENEQIEKIKILGKEKIEILKDEIKKQGGEKISDFKDFGKEKLDELLPKLENTLDEIKKNGGEIAKEKISDAKKFSGKKIKEVKKIFKKEESVGAKMTKIFKK